MNDNGHRFGHAFGHAFGVRLRPGAWVQSQRRKLLAAAAAGLSSAMVLLAGCGPVKLVASTNIPPPLVMKVPIGVALFVPTEFSSYVHKEERWSTKWQIELGKAQTESITRLMGAMFERVVAVDSVNAGTQVPGGVEAILEPSIEEYAFVTPRDAGSPFYAVSIKYRVNVYLPDGKLADSWGFTGYGTAPSQGLSSEGPLHAATASAMRDAGAKLAVEFREQAVVRGLVPGAPTADSPPATPPGPGDNTPPEAPGTETTPGTEATPGTETTPGTEAPSGATPSTKQTPGPGTATPPSTQKAPSSGAATPSAEKASGAGTATPGTEEAAGPGTATPGTEGASGTETPDPTTPASETPSTEAPSATAPSTSAPGTATPPRPPVAAPETNQDVEKDPAGAGEEPAEQDVEPTEDTATESQETSEETLEEGEQEVEQGTDKKIPKQPSAPEAFALAPAVS